MKPLRSADLTHRISIRRATEVDDGRGGYQTSWQTIAQPWAEVTGLDGRESVIEHSLQGISVYRIRIWWRPGVQPADQAQLDGVDLNIRSAVDPDAKRHELVILADTASTR